jgi:peptide chain release factor 3
LEIRVAEGENRGVSPKEVRVTTDALEAVGRLFNTMVVKDGLNRPVLLFKNQWNLNQVESDHPKLKLKAIAPLALLTPTT